MSEEQEGMTKCDHKWVHFNNIEEKCKICDEVRLIKRDWEKIIAECPNLKKNGICGLMVKKWKVKCVDVRSSCNYLFHYPHEFSPIPQIHALNLRLQKREEERMKLRRDSE